MSPILVVAIACTTLLQVTAVEVQAASNVSDDQCGSGHGDYCGSAFSHFHCPGTCCHDSFNAWCCPQGPYKCYDGVFQGSSHCDRSDLCVCSDTKFYVTKVKAKSKPTPKHAFAWDEHLCCEVHSGTQCGWPTHEMSWEKTTSMTWSGTLSATEKITVHQNLLVEGIDFSVELKQSYTRGGAKSEKIAQKVSIACSGEYKKPTYLHYYAETSLYEVPVEITYKHCGHHHTAPGTVKANVMKGSEHCHVHPCKTGEKCHSHHTHGCRKSQSTELANHSSWVPMVV